MSHYIGDLSMPLHVSENYDGQMTGQKVFTVTTKKSWSTNFTRRSVAK